MKVAARILMVIWGFLMVQPAFALLGVKAVYSACSKPVTTKPACSKIKNAGSACAKKKPVTTDCSKKKCNKPSKSQSKNDCNPDGCNPTMGCTSGNFYAQHHDHISLPAWFAQKQKARLIDDNRIIKNLSECWHPPEIG